MKDIMRKHLWPAALVAALAVVGMLAAFVVLTGPQRGTAEAQGICDGATGGILASLQQIGLCGGTGGTTTPPRADYRRQRAFVAWVARIAGVAGADSAGGWAGCVCWSDAAAAGGVEASGPLPADGDAAYLYAFADGYRDGGAADGRAHGHADSQPG